MIELIILSNLIVISCSDTTDVAIETPKNRQLGKLLYSNYYGGYRLKALIVLTFEGYVYSGDLFSGDNCFLKSFA